MTNPKRRTLPAVVAGALGIGAFAFVAGAEPTKTDLQNKVAQMEAKIAALEAAKAPQTAEVNATIDSVLADAEQHSKLLANVAGPGAGHDDLGFFARGDGFELRPAALLQFRWALNYGKDRKVTNSSSDMQSGFEATRMRVMLAGYAADPKLTYFFQWDAGDINGGVGLLDAFVKYQATDQIAIKAGQFLDPLYHEDLVADSNLLAIDRSLLNTLLGGASMRTQGVTLVYGGEKDQFHAEVGYTDGWGTQNTSFQDGGVNWGAVARVEFLAQGNWKDYADLSARLTEQNLLAIGAGVDVTQGDNFTAFRFTVDGQYEMPKSLSLYGAFLGLYTDNRNAFGNTNTFDWGFVVQAGYAIDQIEPFIRFDWTHFKNAQANGRKNTYEITGGLNYYMNKAAKVSVDLTWLPKGAAGAAPYQDIIGGTDQTELVARAQFQLAI